MEPQSTLNNALSNLPQIHPDHKKSRIIWAVILGVVVVAIIIFALYFSRPHTGKNTANTPLTEAQRTAILQNLRDSSLANNAEPLTNAERTAVLNSLSSNQSTKSSQKSQPLSSEVRDSILKSLSR